ncbi:MAG TPA: hypothetical protein VGS13_10270 [Stellaceae bacterium]|nr:hypothetical protein [Stellaceae bacterium]
MPWPFRRKTPAHASFSVGPYRLDSPIEELTGLVEFSPEEYVTMGGRQFKGEKSYNTRQVTFLDRQWQGMIQTVNGHISKIAPRMELNSKQEATPIAMEALQCCVRQFGKLDQQKTGFFVWDTADGNVILQTGETIEGALVALVLTSNSVKKFEMLPGVLDRMARSDPFIGRTQGTP